MHRQSMLVVSGGGTLTHCHFYRQSHQAIPRKLAGLGLLVFGGVTEQLGAGLQNQIRGCDSRRRLLYIKKIPPNLKLKGLGVFFRLLFD